MHEIAANALEHSSAARLFVLFAPGRTVRDGGDGWNCVELSMLSAIDTGYARILQPQRHLKDRGGEAIAAIFRDLERAHGC